LAARLQPQGWWTSTEAPAFSGTGLIDAAQRIREPVHVVQDPATGRIGAGFGGKLAPTADGAPSYPILATLPAIYPEWLGDRSFTEVHRVRFPYVTGAMANGIATPRLVIEMARAGFLGFFGAAGMSLEEIEQAVTEIESALGTGSSWGSNLIHSPNEPDLEAATADLYLRRRVRRVSAGAYMELTPAVVRYACTGLREGPDGRIHRTNHLFAKLSRPEVALRFLEPPPSEILDPLVASGQLEPEEARLAVHLPLAEDITVEADSGGHTDNRPLSALFSTICALRDQVAAKHGYRRPIRLGAAGGLGTPSAVASAFSLGAAYVLTGSVNQACVESGLHASGKEMLAEAGLADVVMAPAADMFELGVEVQVLLKGTMFGVRAKRLYEIYRAASSLEAVPAEDRGWLEDTIFRSSLEDAWAHTRQWWLDRDPREVTRADEDNRHRMALVFRRYLALASEWAIRGEVDRQVDYQIWCGPAMGAFNSWAAGTFLAQPGNRSVVQVARNLMEGAATLTRAQHLRSCGIPMPSGAFDFRPRPLA
jgi:PfaD family protein